MFRTLKEDLDAVMERDPAARSRLEVFFLYSGFKAVRSHRKANWCYRHNLKFWPGGFPSAAGRKTGEIHPGAQIGRGLFIDHRHGGGHWRDHPKSATTAPCTRGSPWGHRQGYRQAPPHLGGQRAHRRGSQGAGALHRGGQRPGGRRRRGAGRRPGRGHRRGRACRVVRINGEKVPAKPPRHPCDDMDQIHVADPVSMELCRLRGEMERLEKRLQELEKAGPTEASL